MAKLKNELKWSHTRQRRWDACRRLYYLAHYAHWNGWRRDATDRQRRCYQLTKMINLPMFAGEVVHGTVETALRDLRAGHTRPVTDWIAEVRRRLNAGWQGSREEKWRSDPKRHTNLFEHFHGLPVDEADIARTRDRAVQCIENFFASAAWSEARESDTAKWRALEELDSFDLGDFGAWVKIDFAREDADGLVWLIDWKTGRVEEEHRDQLLAYALHAHRVWKIPPERIRLAAAYLREGRTETSAVTADDLARAEASILAVCGAMAGACDDAALNTTSEKNFPKTDNRRECARCFFQSLCFDEADWPCKAAAR